MTKTSKKIENRVLKLVDARISFLEGAIQHYREQQIEWQKMIEEDIRELEEWKLIKKKMLGEESIDFDK